MKMYSFGKVLAGLFLIIPLWIQGITLVYGLEERSILAVKDVITLQQAVAWVVEVSPLFCINTEHIVTDDPEVNVFQKNVLDGALVAYRGYFSSGWWFEVISGLEKECARGTGTTDFVASRFGVDDILATGGYNWFVGDNQFVFYGSVGFPTKRTVTCCEIYNRLVGSRFFSAGFGYEYSHLFRINKDQVLLFIFQNRFLHFFNRQWVPILPPDAKIQPGNITDLLWSVDYRIKTDIFEIRYNPSFFTNEAVLLPTEKINEPHFVLHNITCDITHVWEKFPILDIPLLLTVGFDRSFSKFNDIGLWVGWVSVTVIF